MKTLVLRELEIDIEMQFYFYSAFWREKEKDFLVAKNKAFDVTQLDFVALGKVTFCGFLFQKFA